MGENDPGNDPGNEPEIVEIDLEEVIGKVLDDRGLTKETLAKMDKLDVLDSLPGSIAELFKKNRPGKPDNSGLLQEVSDLIDEKLGGLGNGKKNDPGWLTRILSAS